MKNKNLIIAILIVLVGAGAGFFGGMKYRDYQISKQRTSFAGGNFQRNGTGAQGAGARLGGARGINGTILSSDDKSITVKLTDGSSKIILFSDTTQINQAATATKTDLKVGTTVAVFGQTNSDGSVTAQNIQLNPVIRVPDASPPPAQ
ncbi:MAG: DUF5666 domain-containing protein [Candidatus Woesebacteria bacterium]|nr:DUF5666 domain-containing protein [Candidatus Woesebacteria bacterium]